MSLTAKNKAVVRAFWAKVFDKAEDLGCEALSRILVVYPQTKTYFSHWPDLSPGSALVRKHGKTIMGGVGEAVAKIDDLTAGLLTLSELHILSYNILVARAILFPADFTPEVHASVDKFLAALALALINSSRLDMMKYVAIFKA
uniref:Globin domain-containing protein n=1 Tax=Salmo trutta TaxID=8032 RepID=A0A673YDF3_SALTR